MPSSRSDANIIFGAVIDENFKEESRVTVIATGLIERKLAMRANYRNNFSDTDIDIPPFAAPQAINRMKHLREDRNFRSFYSRKPLTTFPALVRQVLGKQVLYLH